MESALESGEGESHLGSGGAGPPAFHGGGGHSPIGLPCPSASTEGRGQGVGTVSQVPPGENQEERRMQRSSCGAFRRSGHAGCAWTAQWASSLCPAVTWPVRSVRPACSSAPSAGPPSAAACAPSCPRPGERAAPVVLTWGRLRGWGWQEAAPPAPLPGPSRQCRSTPCLPLMLRDLL